MNSRSPAKRFKKQGGFLLVAALGFIVAFSFLVFVVSQKMTGVSSTQLLSLLSVQATNAANSGVGQGVYLLKQQAKSNEYCEAMSLTQVFNEAGLKNCSVSTTCTANTNANARESLTTSVYVISANARCGSDSLSATRTSVVTLYGIEQASGEWLFREVFKTLK